MYSSAGVLTADYSDESGCVGAPGPIKSYLASRRIHHTHPEGFWLRPNYTSLPYPYIYTPSSSFFTSINKEYGRDVVFWANFFLQIFVDSLYCTLRAVLYTEVSSFTLAHTLYRVTPVIHIHPPTYVHPQLDSQWPISGVHSIMMEKLAQPGEGG
jgi:hypothetical protein